MCPAVHRTPCKTPCHCEGATRPWQSAPPVPKAPLPKGGWHSEAVPGGFLSPLRTPCNAFVGATLAVARPLHLLLRFRRGGRLCPPADNAPHSLQPFRRGGGLPRPREGQSPSPTLFFITQHRTPVRPQYCKGPCRAGPMCPAAPPHFLRSVIARPVRTLAVAIRIPRPHGPLA